MHSSLIRWGKNKETVFLEKQKKYDLLNIIALELWKRQILDILIDLRKFLAILFFFLMGNWGSIFHTNTAFL